MIGWIVQCLKQENEDRRTDLSEMQKCTKDFSIEKLSEPRWSHVCQRYVETPLHQKNSECFPLEIFSIYPRKERKD